MESQAYLRALNTQLTYLFAYVRKINEIDTAAGLLANSVEYRMLAGILSPLPARFSMN